jgi:hypothetical protein
MYTPQKKLTHFGTKSSKIIISSRAGSTLQKRSLLYETQKKKKLLILSMVLNFVILWFIRYSNNN